MKLYCDTLYGGLIEIEVNEKNQIVSEKYLGERFDRRTYTDVMRQLPSELLALLLTSYSDLSDVFIANKKRSTRSDDDDDDDRVKSKRRAVDSGRRSRRRRKKVLRKSHRRNRKKSS